MDNTYEPTNREKKLAPRKSKFYCRGCDGSLMAAGGKCKRCGHKAEKRRLKT